MKHLLPFLILFVFMYSPGSFAEDKAEESVAVQLPVITEEAEQENLNTLDNALEFAGKEQDALRFRWLSHQREIFALEQEKLVKEVGEMEKERASFDQQYQNKDFDDASQEIDTIRQKITAVEQTIYEIKQKQVTDDVGEAAQAQLVKMLEQQNALLNIHQEQLEAAQLRLNQATHSVQFSAKQLSEQEANIKKKKEEISRIAAQRFEVETQISVLLNRDSLENAFRVQISIAFTVLVAIVILGFYWLAIRKDDIAKNIFVGEKGIQFITLFLIVIAIILFGIMGTLEGRELSALLGALAGYILGKTTIVPDKSDSGNQNQSVSEIKQ